MEEKLLKEVDSILGPINDDFMGKFDLNVAEEFQYLRLCFLETLRMESPLS